MASTRGNQGTIQPILRVIVNAFVRSARASLANRRTIASASLLLAALWFHPSITDARPLIGSPAPEFQIVAIDGDSYSNETLRGKVVVFESFSPDCPYSANHYKTGAMQELQETFTKQGVVWLTVNATHKDHPSYHPPESASEDVTRLKMKSTDYIDDHTGQLSLALGFRVTPQFVIIDPKGAIAYTGAIDDRPESFGDPRKAKNYVREALNALLNNEPIPTPNTRPYGCGVKY